MIIKIYVEHETPSILNAIFFSVATITTLGYYPPDVALHSGVGRWFSLLYLLSGMALIFGSVQALVTPFMEYSIKRAISKGEVPIPKDAHVVICGWNETAKVLEEQLKLMDMPYVIIAPDAPDSAPSVRRVATEISVLQKANVARALAVVCVMDDENNAVSILSTRRLNRDVKIIAVSNGKLDSILRRAGADVVISRRDVLSAILGHWSRGDFFHLFSGEILTNLSFKEIMVKDDLANKMLKNTNLRITAGTVIGIYRGGELILNPAADTILKEGDTLIVIGGDVS